MITPWRSESGFLSWFPSRLQEPAKNINEMMKMLGKRKAQFIRINKETSQDSFQVTKVKNEKATNSKSPHVSSSLQQHVVFSLEPFLRQLKALAVSICSGGNYFFFMETRAPLFLTLLQVHFCCKENSMLIALGESSTEEIESRLEARTKLEASSFKVNARLISAQSFEAAVG